VISQRARDIDHLLYERLVMRVDGAGKIHDVSGIPVPDRRQHQHLIGDLPTGPERDSLGADDIDI
jgi:hypothetical protein